MNRTPTLFSLVLFAITATSQAQSPASGPGQEPEKFVTGYAKAGGGCDTIDFNAYGTGIVITDQYLNCGVIFVNSDIYDYGTGSYGPVLKSLTWYDHLTVNFVNPLDSTQYFPVRYIGFDNPIDTEIDYIVVKVYNTDGALVHSYTSTSPERVEIDLGTPVGAYMVVDDSLTTAYVIDNLTLSGASTASVQEVEPSVVHAYPDPFNEVIHVNCDGAVQLRLMDLSGRILLTEGNGSTILQSPMQLSTPDLPRGTYLLEVRYADRALTMKMVK